MNKLKKNIKGFAIGIIVGIGTASTTSVFANNLINAVFKDDFNYVVNGKSVSVPPAVVVHNKNYLPTRELAEMFGYKVSYDAPTRTIMFDNGQAEVKETFTEINTPSSNCNTNYK